MHYFRFTSDISVFNSCTWLMATTFASTGFEHFHRHGKFYWTAALLYTNGSPHC